MAKVNAPLLSLGGRGQIGKGIVFSSWKGIKTARQYVVPANPRTTAQQNNRIRFALLREMFKLAPTQVVEPYNAFVEGRPLTNANKFVGENNRLLNGQADLLAANMSPGAKGGLPPMGIVAAATANPGEITVTVTPPDQLPSGWTITSCDAAACRDQDPVGIFEGPFLGGSDLSAPYEITLSGLPAATNCVAWGWVVYEKPNGDMAYSVSLSQAVTTV